MLFEGIAFVASGIYASKAKWKELKYSQRYELFKDGEYWKIPFIGKTVKKPEYSAKIQKTFHIWRVHHSP